MIYAIIIVSLIVAILCIATKKIKDNSDIQKEKEELLKDIELLKEKNEFYILEEEKFKKDFDVFCEDLRVNYQEKEKEYLVLNKKLEEECSIKESELVSKINEIQLDLDKLQTTRSALIEANIREKQISEDNSFYCLQISDEDIDDIKKLEEVKRTLHQPRILSMLIWQTYFQKPLKTKATEILGTSTVTGIYKITNIITNECYIGQAADVATRWNEHAKYGLGIDTPPGNKLYKAIKEYGLQNFSWELLEKCPRTQLNEKEKYYIELYQSKNFGYNSINGISKKEN